MIQTTLRIDESRPIGTISPRLYGQFAEHLGRCCYDGFWVGKDNKHIEHQDGFRVDVLNAIKAMPTPLLRWPGGCYADHYHWRDGIGAPEKRPRRIGMSCGIQVEDDNSLGTHEFLEFCKRIGAEPYLAGNMGTGSPQELCDWVEYCNSTWDTDLTRERKANGADEPFNVRLWGVGNENWGCGGSYDVDTYGKEYIRYATMIRHVDPAAELVVCGHNDEWNEQLVKVISRQVGLVDHYSIHSYWIHGGTELNFSEQEYYGLMEEVDGTEAFVRRTADMLQAEFGDRRKVGIALDEWGIWHPEARSWGPGEVERRPLSSSYEQAGTLRDAIATAATLESFHRQMDVLTLANLAQIVNVLHAPVMTQDAKMWVTPTYYVFQLHKPHIGATLVPVSGEHQTQMPNGKPYITATASTQNGALAVTVINKHFAESSTVTLAPGKGYSHASAELLAGDSAHAENSISNPDNVKLAALPVNKGDAGWTIELPAHSVATVQFS